MMPFSVLRTVFLGLFGWAILGIGGYLIYEWSNGVSPPEAVLVSEPDSLKSPNRTPKERTVIVQHDRRGGWPYLLSGVAVLIFSSGAWRWPSVLVRLSSPYPVSSPPLRTERLIRPDGSELHLVHYGSEGQPTLLFTHGWGLDQSDWDAVRVAFGDRYHLVFWDLAGLGKSSAPGNADHSLEKMAADLEAVLTQATEGPVILVGHSIGGMIQQVFCRLFPQHLESRVKGVVFVHTTYTNPTMTAMGSPLLIALQEPVLKPLTYLTIGLAPLAWISNWQSYWNGSLHLSARLTSFAGNQTWSQIDHVSRLQARAWPAVVGRGCLAMTAFDEQATLPHVTVPALVIVGANDRLTKPEAGQFLAKQLPTARLIALQPAGHFGHWEQADTFHEALLEFAASVAWETSPQQFTSSNDRNS